MSTLTILDRLLDQSTTSESQEHVIEQMHYAMENVQQRCLEKFEQIVSEISESAGTPEFNGSVENTGAAQQNPMPSWVLGSKQASNSSVRIMRLSYWRRENGMSYLILRQELDSKDRPKYYDLVLGGRKRTKSNAKEIGKLRQKDTSILGWLKRLVGQEK